MPLQNWSTIVAWRGGFEYSLYEASCLVVEKGVVVRREDTAGRIEAGDVVVGRLDAVGGGSSRGHDETIQELEVGWTGQAREGVTPWPGTFRKGETHLM
jgi:hypothetical protein